MLLSRASTYSKHLNPKGTTQGNTMIDELDEKPIYLASEGHLPDCEQYSVCETCDCAEIKLKARIAELEAALTQNQWQPIETAPKDGTLIFVWYEHPVNKYAVFDIKIKLANWIIDLHEWQVADVGGNVPPILTHWMPLPHPPDMDKANE